MAKPKIVNSRPVKCHFCKKPMHYAGDPRWVSEVSVTVEPEAKIDEATGHLEQPLSWEFYTHEKCWNRRKRSLTEFTRGVDYRRVVVRKNNG